MGLHDAVLIAALAIVIARMQFSDAHWKTGVCALLSIALVSLPVPVWADTKPLTVSALFEGQTLSPDSPFELRLSRPPAPAEGSIAVFIGSTDITDLIEASAATLRYRPQLFSLPAGETDVSVYLVSPARKWKRIAQFALKVAGGTDASQPRTQAGAAAQAAPEKAGFAVIPSLTISAKSQPGIWHWPASPRPERTTFTDYTLQGSLQTNLQRGTFGWQSQFDLVGSSYSPEALRYGVLGARAPRIDLSSYLMQFKLGAARLGAGHLTHGSNKHLISDFASRGMTLTVPVGKRTDLSIAALNGTNIVGWGNFFGLDRRDHQVVSGKLGYEVFDKQPGMLRVEASFLNGSLLPETGVNQGLINDAEKSRGAGLRVSAADKAQRLQLNAGFTHSHSFNPHDPLLDPARTALGVRASTGSAYYLDTSYKLVQDARIANNTKASLQVNYLHERVDPLYRSVAAADVQPNKLVNQAGVVATIGEIAATYSYLQFRDNLDDIPSLLKTRTDRHGVTIGARLTALFGSGRSPEKPSAWLPLLSYSFDRTHQFAESLPVNADFKEPQLPDQVGVNHLLTAEWQSPRWRYSYRLNFSSQENLGINRQGDRLNNLINGFTVGFNPHTAFDVNLDVSVEQALNRETNMNKDSRRDARTLRFGLFANWRPSSRQTVTANLSNTGMRSIGDLTLANSNRNAQFDLQWSWRFLGKDENGQEQVAKFRPKLKAQFYVRFAYRYAWSRDELQKLHQFNRINTVNTGLNFTFF